MKSPIVFFLIFFHLLQSMKLYRPDRLGPNLIPEDE